jgi:hypothetical protein
MPHDKELLMRKASLSLMFIAAPTACQDASPGNADKATVADTVPPQSTRVHVAAVTPLR